MWLQGVWPTSYQIFHSVLTKKMMATIRMAVMKRAATKSTSRPILSWLRLPTRAIRWRGTKVLRALQMWTQLRLPPSLANPTATSTHRRSPISSTTPKIRQRRNGKGKWLAPRNVLNHPQRSSTSVRLRLSLVKTPSLRPRLANSIAGKLRVIRGIATAARPHRCNPEPRWTCNCVTWSTRLVREIARIRITSWSWGIRPFNTRQNSLMRVKEQMTTMHTC